MKTIKKSIEISAPKEKVWAVLLEESHTKDWYSLFGEGTTAQTDWIEGHKVVFSDKANNGLVGKIASKRPYEFLSIEYEGVIENGTENFDSELARSFKGAEETYTLEDRGANTLLSISSDMDDSSYESMGKAWESALQRISELSHAI